MSGWHYLMLVNVYLVLFYLFYVVLLRRETFFHLNRVYLVSAVIFSLLIPVIHSDWVKDLFITQKVQYTIYSSPVMIYTFKPMQDTQITIGQILIACYLAGVIILTLRTVWQLIAVRKIINKPHPSAAFSFFKNISLGDNLVNNEVICAHEYVHAREWHSADVLLIEAVMIFNWFNPVVYFYRFAIKHIHEYIADRQAVDSGTDKADYALLLLSQTFNAPAHYLVNPFFNHSLLKQRIMMLQKDQSRKAALVKYGLSAPLFVLMLILSSATVNNSRTIKLFNHQAQKVLLSAATLTPVRTDVTIITTPPEAPGNKNNNVGKPSIESEKTVERSADTVPLKSGPVFTSVEQVPEFPGGMEGFGRYLAKNIRYPDAARRNHTQGRVFVSFVVEKDGALSDIHAVRSVGDGTDDEAVRVISMSPKWKPGIQNGKPVRVQYTVPISFTLDGKLDRKNGLILHPDMSSRNPVEAIIIKRDTGKKVADFGPGGMPGKPLYVIDGQEVSSIANVNPINIESISVLKDQAATSLYGKKGENGVIVISMKKTKPKQ